MTTYYNDDSFCPTRRKFGKILIGSAGSLALGVPGCANINGLLSGQERRARWYATDGPTKGEINVDVAVVGAGLSGLTAARMLVKQKKSVVVLEASDRIGGRMYLEKTLNDAVLDMGGQWVGDTQTAILGLLEELGVSRFISYADGRSIHSWNSVKTAFDGDVAKLLEGRCEKPNPLLFNNIENCISPPLVVPECHHDYQQAKIWNKFMAIARSISPDRPWQSKNANLLDAINFQTWLNNEGASDYSRWLSGMLARIGGSGGFEPNAVSLLHMAWTQRVAPQSESPERWLINGGAGRVPHLLANELGNNIAVSAPVHSIEQDSQGVTLFTNGLIVRAKRAIVAVPPPLRARILFTPALPPTHAGFIQRSPMGSISKVHAVYPEAFWRKQCLSGMGAGNLKTCEFIADSSPENGNPGILTSFIAGKRNIELSEKSEAEIEHLVLTDFASYLGADAWKVAEFIHLNWDNEKWTTGAFTTYLPPGVWSTYGKGWRDPVGHIFWAGTETAEKWPGYFDGAVSAGLRTAEMVRQTI